MLIIHRVDRIFRTSFMTIGTRSFGSRISRFCHIVSSYERNGQAKSKMPKIDARMNNKSMHCRMLFRLKPQCAFLCAYLCVVVVVYYV
mmetsp:Transcript_15498/g.29245  ORF Transcript_15498/g.29245 Transcript_15498/m.29245 type:complete len:88 (+) Transcript_15498:3285-3548(+)